MKRFSDYWFHNVINENREINYDGPLSGLLVTK